MVAEKGRWVWSITLMIKGVLNPSDMYFSVCIEWISVQPSNPQRLAPQQMGFPLGPLDKKKGRNPTIQQSKISRNFFKIFFKFFLGT